MKTLDKFRDTKAFCITSLDVNALVKVACFFGSDLIAVANDVEDPFRFTVRAFRRGPTTDLVDYAITTEPGDAEIKDMVVIRTGIFDEEKKKKQKKGKKNA